MLHLKNGAKVDCRKALESTSERLRRFVDEVYTLAALRQAQRALVLIRRSRQPTIPVPQVWKSRKKLGWVPSVRLGDHSYLLVFTLAGGTIPYEKNQCLVATSLCTCACLDIFPRLQLSQSLMRKRSASPDHWISFCQHDYVR
jgi:hypothetical protein